MSSDIAGMRLYTGEDGGTSCSDFTQPEKLAPTMTEWEISELIDSWHM